MGGVILTWSIYQGRLTFFVDGKQVMVPNAHELMALQKNITETIKNGCQEDGSLSLPSPVSNAREGSDGPSV